MPRRLKSLLHKQSPPARTSAAGIKILEQLRRYDEAGGAEGAGGAGGDISCSVISAFLH
ncbi:hypothetical protein MC7420_8024 [Coleofasciculus chthonoplastes PCC 7420]|uniref:Uncharacterized protein n=1 Tax=Coleofasciculus chthonoplastes PCC 7420 TaxID=118168 RepID=B4VJ40_9CYAN|nr:hypothetical protein MC7420_8024 [Coleofasciculus chthonoplastes PCC 7420]